MSKQKGEPMHRLSTEKCKECNNTGVKLMEGFPSVKIACHCSKGNEMVKRWADQESAEERAAFMKKVIKAEKEI